MVNQETSESLLDTLILQIFEEQEDSFSFPLTTMKQTRDFVRLLNRNGFTYEMICAEIDEKCDAFRNWRLGGGPDSIGRRTMTRLNKPLQEAMLSDGEDEEEETVRNGTEKASGGGGGARRKKSVDGGGRGRRSSRVDSVDGEKKGKTTEEGGKNPEKKGEAKGQEETGKSEKVDTKDGKNKDSDNHSKPSSSNDVAKADDTKVVEKREEKEKDNATTTNAVATTKGATANTIKTNNEVGNENVTDNSNKVTKHENAAVEAVKKDASKELETSKDIKKKEHEAEAEKKEPGTSKEKNLKEEETITTTTMTNPKATDRNTETKSKTTTEQETKTPSGTGPQKSHPDDKQESKKKDSKAEQKEQKTDRENSTKDDQKVEKATTTTGSVKTPPTNKIPSETSAEKSPKEVPRSLDKVIPSSTPSPKSEPSSPTSPSFNTPRPASASKKFPEVKTACDNKDKRTTDPSPKATPTSKLHGVGSTPSSPKKDAPPSKGTTETPTSKLHGVGSTPSSPTVVAAPPSKDINQSSPTKTEDKTVSQNLTKPDKHADKLETKILPDASKTSSSSTIQTDKVAAKLPDKEIALPSTLTTDNIVRSKSEIVDTNTKEATKDLARTSSDNNNIAPSRPTSTPSSSPKTNSSPTTKSPPSEPTEEETVDENYDSDLDSATLDHSADDRILISRLLSLKRNQTTDGPGHLFVFSDTPAATGTGKHRVRIGNSRFPEKRLAQAQLFNPDIRMVASVAVAMRKDALCRAQDELKSMSLRGKRGWYWGSLEAILKVVSEFSVDKEDDVTE